MRRDQLIGRTIAKRFRIKRVLGEGGMATVFVAEQDAEPREVALKILRSELTSDKSFAKRFEREARAAASVQHPSSVTIFDAGVDGKLSYIAMELLRGDDLFTILERHGSLSPRAATTILTEVCDALSVAHRLGIVHRDLKPENIMIVREASAAHLGGPQSVPLPPGSRVKVLDFGIAKLLDSPQPAPKPRGNRLDPPSAMTAVTRAGTLIGTPAYMSPEQCALLPIDTRSDIYTCGVLLFQMISGRLPFEGPTPLHIATKHLHEDAPTLRSVLPDADATLDALISKALAKRPEDRYQTAQELGAALRKLAPALPDVAYPGAPQLGRDLDEVTTDSYALDTDGPTDEMSGAKTVVANGVAGPPPSVLVHHDDPRGAVAALARPARRDGSEPPPEPAFAEPAVESEPEDLAATLIRASIPGDFPEGDPAAMQQPAPTPHDGRQATMQSAGVPPEAPAGQARVPHVAVVAPAPIDAGNEKTRSMPSNIAGPPPAVASVIVAASAMPAPAPAPLPAPAQQTAPQGYPVVPAAPTFGFPPAAQENQAPPPTLGRALWIGILIGTALSALLFGLVYFLILSE